MRLNLIPVLRVMENDGGTPHSKPSERVLNDPHCIRYNEIGFVEMCGLASIATGYTRVPVYFPAPCRPEHIEQDRKCGGWPRVSFVVYWSANRLLLVEDIEKYCQRRLEFGEIRSIFDLKKELTVSKKEKKDESDGIPVA